LFSRMNATRKTPSVTAHQTPAGIFLNRDAYLMLPWRDRDGVAAPGNAVLAHHLYFEGGIVKLEAAASDQELGEAVQKLLEEPARDTAGLGYDDIDRGQSELFRVMGVTSFRAFWKIAERVVVRLEPERIAIPNRFAWSSRIAPSRGVDITSLLRS